MAVLATYSQICTMEPNGVEIVQNVITSHPEFLGITLTVDPIQGKSIPEGQVQVTLQIPSEGIYMPNFFREWSQALNQESTPTISGGKERA